MTRRFMLAAGLLLLVPLRAHAADQTVLGKEVLVKNPSTVDKRLVIVKAQEPATDNTLVGDPTTGGATLTISLYGGTASAQTFALPATLNAKGKPFWKGSAAKGFKYSDPKGENGPVKIVQIKKSTAGAFQIKAILKGKNGTISTLPPNDGDGACALLAVGGGDSYSVRFAEGDGDVTNKGAALFKDKNPTSQGTCVTCGNGFMDPNEQCDPGGVACPTNAGTCQSDCTCTCDFLDPSDCMFPFPSDYLTVADATTDSGRRVHFNLSAMPMNSSSVHIDPTGYNLNDGFSEGVTILTHVPNVDLAMTGATPITDIGSSLNANAPIVVVNATTLAHQILWAELDANAGSEPQRALIIHPATNFTEGQRYIVALRDMKDSGGATIAPNADFQAYRDNTPTGDPAKEARRAHMESLFTTLAAAGVPRNNLYLAWDFTVESERNNTERMLFIRDDGFARLGGNAPTFAVTKVLEHPCTAGTPAYGACANDADCVGGGAGSCNTSSTGIDSNILRRVVGTYNVERYVDSTTPPAKFQLDANGLPIHQATPQVASFICNIPFAALPTDAGPANPARASIYGHGLLGSNTEVSSGNVEAMANEHNFVFCATKWIGMADEDVGTAVGILQDLSKFPNLTDRLQQSFLNQLYLARLMIHAQGFVSDPAFQDASSNPVIDTSDVFFDGNSQGGIFGGSIMAIAQDITRGVLGVTGMNYSLLLTRSTDFSSYAAFLYPAYPNQLERPLDLALIQMLWDRSDPSGYAQHIIHDPLPGTPVHAVLMHEAFGDHQVANIGTECEARTIGVDVHQPAINAGRKPDVVPFYGIPAVPSDPFNGSALVMWDSGANPPPLTNTAPTTGPDPHSDPRNDATARVQKSDFLQTGGQFVDVCSGSPCTIP